MAKRKIPVVVVAGFLGSGKTTLLNHLLRNTRGARIGVIVNDFGSVNIDSMMVAGQVDSMVSLSNGCLCCAIDVSDMDAMLDKLAHPKSDLDVIVVEASGLAEPRNMIRLVVSSENEHITYGGLVLVVDAYEFDTTRERHPELDQHVAMADLILLNKTDRVDTETHDDLLGRLCGLNARAAVVSTDHSRVDPGLLFDFSERAEPRPGEQLTLDDLLREHDEHDHRHLHDGYDSITFESDAPLHPRALVDLLENQPAGVFRIKGYVTVTAGLRSTRYLVQTVGDHIRFEPPGRGDDAPGTTRLVVIGADLDSDAVREQLGRCVADEPVSADAMYAVHRFTPR
ncbi:G3E family GTPase [Rhodococcus sp. SMB37]|uniref:CobW family GTP-binding protein n=1 Tax=Rhodococcus sp. SMB37 TaxID=2512213 RepID=UPI0006D1ECEB|nr:GTP-binding protein [Rhodococcus sp. SMB37]TCN57025.1 G3E family GTPase [Rhodococcus sp. SMB37]